MRTDTVTETSSGTEGAESVAITTVKLCSGAFLRKANTKEFEGPDICDLEVGDTIFNGSSTESCTIEVDNGASVDVKPLSRLVMVSQPGCQFDMQVELGSATMTNTPAAAIPRRKLLRSPAVSIGALGSDYTWSVDSGGNNMVSFDSGTQLEIVGPNWPSPVNIPVGYHVVFRDYQSLPPTPIQNAVAVGP
jgi:hypothetical protein